VLFSNGMNPKEPEPVSESVIDLGGLRLKSPFLAASGTFGWGDELPALLTENLPGAIITPSVTLEPRAGNPMPRTVEVTAGLLHATGLPNPGVEAFIQDKMPTLRALDCPIIVSIWAEYEDELEPLAQRLADVPGIAALELNLLPSYFVHQSGRRDDYTFILNDSARSVKCVRSVWTGTLIAKLPPIGIGIAEYAYDLERSGADILSVSQGFPGRAVKPTRRGGWLDYNSRLSNETGIVSGAAIKPLALYQVVEAVNIVHCPVIGGGGIMTPEDAEEFFAVGAAAVSIGTATLIHPSVFNRLSLPHGHTFS
jgi:dihydroorotate dehydrogenase (NAD+) catalytic subunit